MTVKIFLPLIVAVAPFLGCMNADQPQLPAPPTHPVQITLLGDQTRVELIKQLAAASDAVLQDNTEQINAVATMNDRLVTVTTKKSDNVAAHASNCSVADLAVITVDARNGPMPVHREHILFARQMHIPNVLVTFTHSNTIGDPELLELEELELRELLNAYGWNGDEALVAFTPDGAKIEHNTGALLGIHALFQCFSQVVERPKIPPVVDSAGCTVEMYALCVEEAFPIKTNGISSGKYTLVLGNSTLKVEVQPTSTIGPGQSGSARLNFNVPLRVHQGQRFAILTDDHVIAVGIITSTKR